MSSALVRQALEFVDQEESGGKSNKKRSGASRRNIAGQEHPHPYKQRLDKQKNKRSKTEPRPSPKQDVEATIKKLLELSKPTADKDIGEKIVKRAVKGKPLLEKIEVKKEEYKSILFPDEEPHSKFEKEYFCS